MNIYNDLNDKNESIINLEVNNNFLVVKLFQSPSNVKTVHDFQIPIFKYDKIDLSYLSWDISFQHLLRHIDGFNNIKKISKLANMDILVVKKCLMLLLFHDCVFITCPFKFSNVYEVNIDISLVLLADPVFVVEMKSFCSIENNNNNNNNNSPTSKQLMDILFQIKNGKTIKEIIIESLNSSHPIDNNNINLKHLFVFWEANCLIKRIHEYPIYIQDLNKIDNNNSDTPNKQTIASQTIDNNNYNNNKVKSNHIKHLSFSDNLETTDQSPQRPKSFHKLINRSKTVLGKNYLKNDLKNNNLTVKDLLLSFNGDFHIDYICCKYETSYQDIMSYPGVFIILK